MLVFLAKNMKAEKKPRQYMLIHMAQWLQPTTSCALIVPTRAVNCQSAVIGCFITVGTKKKSILSLVVYTQQELLELALFANRGLTGTPKKLVSEEARDFVHE